MRVALMLGVCVLLSNCSGAQARHSGGRLSAHTYLSAIQATSQPIRNGASGAPMLGLVVSGTVTNGGRRPLLCSAGSFVLVKQDGYDVIPSSEFCSARVLSPKQSTYFNATFAAVPAPGLRLRFEHADGSYEVHDLGMPPQ